jgi:hypothetical protein
MISAELRNKIFAEVYARNLSRLMLLNPKLLQTHLRPNEIVVEHTQVEITQQNNGRPKTKFLVFDYDANIVGSELSREEINSLVEI